MHHILCNVVIHFSPQNHGMKGGPRLAKSQILLTISQHLVCLFTPFGYFNRQVGRLHTLILQNPSKIIVQKLAGGSQPCLGSSKRNEVGRIMKGDSASVYKLWI